MRATRLEDPVKERFGNEVMGEEDVVPNITLRSHAKYLPLVARLFALNPESRILHVNSGSFNPNNFPTCLISHHARSYGILQRQHTISSEQIRPSKKRGGTSLGDSGSLSSAMKLDI